jgi:hypothetical protein
MQAFCAHCLDTSWRRVRGAHRLKLDGLQQRAILSHNGHKGP